jgi:hypothetical protein
MAVLSREQAGNYARAAGFTGRSLDIVLAIAQAESSLVTNARNRNTDGSTDRGILQINDRYHPEVSTACADSPACAFSAGYSISNGGSNFTPWSTYTSGAYLQYLGADDDGEPNPADTPGVEAYRAALLPNGVLISVWGDGRAQGPHQGEDLQAPKGSPIYAPEPGVITGQTTDPLGGNVFYFSGDSGINLYGAHLDRKAVYAAGTRVNSRAVLGYVGNSGDAATTVAHLHYQVRFLDSEWDDPRRVLEDWQAGTGGSGGGGGSGSVIGATLYDAPGFDGHSHDLSASVARAEVKAWFGDSTAHVRSIDLSPGTVATVYRDINYAGPSERFTSSVSDLVAALPWANPVPGGKVLSSMKLESAGGGSGGSGRGILGSGGFSGISDVVHGILSHTPGFYGVALAIDAAEQFPGYVSVGGDSNILTGGLGNMIRSVWLTIGANTLPLVVRGLTVWLGLFLVMALLWNALGDRALELAEVAI